MGYIERSLGQDEILIQKAHFHWFHRGLGYLALFTFLAAAGYLFIELRLLWLTAAIAAVGFVIFLHTMVPIWTTEIGVTSDRLIIKREPFARSTDELELLPIEEVNMDQSLLGRILDFGQIPAQGAGDDSLDIPRSPSRWRFTEPSKLLYAKPQKL
jgi:uncharacterized membrane protein YdbT with pleckstrin-like domain